VLLVSASGLCGQGREDAARIRPDGDLLAVTELRQREYAAWEPGQASNWRDALTSWYLASRVALHDDRALTAEIQIETVKTCDQTLAHALEMRAKGINAVDALDRLEVALDSSDVSTDSTTRTTHELYMNPVCPLEEPPRRGAGRRRRRRGCAGSRWSRSVHAPRPDSDWAAP
jgi:hypothetical protein